MRFLSSDRKWLWVCLSVLVCFEQAHSDGSSAMNGDAGKKLAEHLRNRNREVDPFGCAMNPTTKKALVVEAPVLAREEPASRTSLEIALQALTINGVNPRARTVLIGARRLKVGDHFVFKHNEIDMRLAISEISLTTLTIADLDTGEKVVHKLDIAPNLQTGRGESTGSPIRLLQGPLTVR